MNILTEGFCAPDTIIKDNLSIFDKLKILTDAAKYDVACTSSGVARQGDGTGIGNSLACGLCHSFASDGRCISLLKVLFTNECIYDCKYCVNRCSNDVKRTSFTPEELCELTIEFYRRNLIEGLFLSSGIINSPDYTMELIYTAINMLRTKYRFQGYIHVKAIPGTSEDIIHKVGLIADRMSINLEFPTGDGLKKLCPNKTRSTILKPMRLIQNGISASKNEIVHYKSAPSFVPAGQSSQMIIGATNETDYQIVNVAAKLYENFNLKRVFYSGFVNVNNDPALPGAVDKYLVSDSCNSGSINTLTNHTPESDIRNLTLLREHRLYQADFLMRFYEFKANEILSEEKPYFNTMLDPKANWAINNLDMFPVEINTADKNTLLRVPGIGPRSVRKILMARRLAPINFDSLKKMGVVLKRALYFITCNGKMMYPTKIDEEYILKNLLNINERLPEGMCRDGSIYKQLSLFETNPEIIPESNRVITA
ncbi:MAG: putative DNA modification/repair radical SAM protein [Lachnospiraceae bacterium]|nr:putative DNA modification/repair radical SAM protein [Lachnospiraceae bacterium]